MKAHRLILIVSLFFVLLAAWFSQGFHHPDEYFQIFEFASWKAGITPSEDLPWEFQHKMRPALQPALVYFVIKASQSLGWFHPFYIMAFFRALAGVLFFVTSWLLWKNYARDFASSKQQTTLLFLALLLWPVPYLAVRFSSENVAGCLFFLALILLKEPARRKAGALLLAGFLLGLSFHARYQMAFAIVGLGLWLLLFHGKKFHVVLLTVTGGILALAAGFLLDVWFYDEGILAPYNYYFQNIVLKKAAGFGVEPWYYYLRKLVWGQLLLVGPLVLLGYLLMLITRWKHVFVWVSVPFLIGHSLVSHKEFRFLFPLYSLVPYAVMCSFEFLGRISWLVRVGLFLKKPALVLNSLLLLVAVFLPPSDNFWFLKNLYELPIKPETLVVYEEEHNYRNPYDDGILHFTFLKNPEHRLRFVPFSAWSRAPMAFHNTENCCPVFICKIRDEGRVKKAAEKICGDVYVAYENLYAPLLRKIQDKGIILPPDVKAYIIFIPVKNKSNVLLDDNY